MNPTAPDRCSSCRTAHAARRWNGQPVCAGCHRRLLREAFGESARKLLADRRIQTTLLEIARENHR